MENKAQRDLIEKKERMSKEGDKTNLTYSLKFVSL